MLAGASPFLRAPGSVSPGPRPAGALLFPSPAAPFLCPPAPRRPHTPCPVSPFAHLPISSVSWYPPRAHTRSRRPLVRTTRPSCPRPWNAPGALGTPGLHPSSEWTCGWEGPWQGWGVAHRFGPGLGEGAPSLPHAPPSPLPAAALTPVGAARRIWTTTRRRTPWCLPSASGHAGEMVPSTVRLPCPLPPPTSSLHPVLPAPEPAASPRPMQPHGSTALPRGSGGGSQEATTARPP